MKELKNKIVLITGSSIGIGKELALKLAKEKAKLILTYYKDKEEGEKTLELCKTLGSTDIMLVNLDIKNDKSIKSCIKETVSKFQHIDILINNAGIYYWDKLEDQTYSQIEEQLKTNLEGLIKMTKESIPHIKEQIINISSISGLKGSNKLSIYCATKFAVRGFSQSIAQELPKIKVICINPGPYGTRMNDFQGTSPEIAADRILKVIKEDKLKSGEEITI